MSPARLMVRFGTMAGAPKVYLETTVISYLTARPSRNLQVAAHQLVTADWWTRRRKHFELYVSRLVVDEAAAGDADAAAERLANLSGLPRLELTEPASALAVNLVRESAIPREAAEDAVHVAVAAAHGMTTCSPGAGTSPMARCEIGLPMFAPRPASKHP
jgi:hypothetical protein